jgi:hypothetical protein
VSRKGLLIRVGIDSTDGNWNAPVDAATGEFAYVTITEVKQLRPGLARFYDEFEPAIAKFRLDLPPHLKGLPTHLDPDFSTLTYGDQGSRAKQIMRLGSGDLLAFYASLRDTTSRNLVYALIGLYMIEDIVSADSVPRDRWMENAHTRRFPGLTDIVVRARAKVSGRLEKCIPLGEYRDRAYRVKRELVDAWGGLSVQDGYLQRSGRLPAFQNATKFYTWFLTRSSSLLQKNN